MENLESLYRARKRMTSAAPATRLGAAFTDLSFGNCLREDKREPQTGVPIARAFGFARPGVVAGRPVLSPGWSVAEAWEYLKKTNILSAEDQRAAPGVPSTRDFWFCV